MARRIYTKDVVQQRASMFSSVGDWIKDDRGSYDAAVRYGWLAEITQNMTKLVEHGKWTKSATVAKAREFSHIKIWQKESQGSYKAARRNGWMKECTAHMRRPSNYNLKWTLGSVLEDARGYDDRTEWQKGSPSAYIACLRNGWLEHVNSLLPLRKIPNGSWTKQLVLDSAKPYNNSVQWAKDFAGAANAAYKNGWYDEATVHMSRSGGTSYVEQDLQSIILQYFPDAKKNYKIRTKQPVHGIIHGFELDIYIPELNKGIEFNGTYWHSEAGLKRGRPDWPDDLIKNYHNIKREFFESRGIEYTEITEQDWNEDFNLCIKKCLEFLGVPHAT